MGQQIKDRTKQLTKSKLANGICRVLLNDERINLVHLVESESLDLSVTYFCKMLVEYAEQPKALTDNRNFLAKAVSRVWSILALESYPDIPPHLGYVRQLLEKAGYGENALTARNGSHLSELYYVHPAKPKELEAFFFIDRKPCLTLCAISNSYQVVGIYSDKRLFPGTKEELPRHMKPIIYNRIDVARVRERLPH